MTLQARLDAFKADFTAGRPPYNASAEVSELMARGTSELVMSGAARRVLKAGDHAPDFELRDPDGNMVRSSDLLARGPLAVSFHRGTWCPYCKLELGALEESLPLFRRLGTNLIAISPQIHGRNRKATKEDELSLPVLSDYRNVAAEAFGVRYELPEYLIELYLKLGHDLPSINGDPTWSLPMPARFVIGQDHKIHYAEVNPDYTLRPEPVDMLIVLRGMVISQLVTNISPRTI